MKKILLIFSLLAVALMLTACVNSDDIHLNSIGQADLSERDDMLLSLGGSRYFAFDFRADETYGYIKTWIERYENGKKTKTFGRMTTRLEPGKAGMFVVLMNEKDFARNDWTMAISSGRSLSNDESTQDNPIMEAGNCGSAPFINQRDSKIEGEEVALAGIFYDSMQDGTGAVNSISQEYLNDPESHQNELENLDLVFIVKSEFSKTEK